MAPSAAGTEAAPGRTGEEIELYGGALSCELPVTFADASNFRQVPDHQEVWVDSGSDRSFMVEILERKTEVSDDRAVEFFLQDLAEFNDARNSRVLSSRKLDNAEIPGVPADAACFVGVGEQSVAKFNDGRENTLHVHLCAIRLRELETDLLVMLNNPVAIDPESSSADVPVLQGAEELFARLLRSFRIIDVGLFQG
eukprot:TRINITY_DN15506_c0_g1_i1.p1 TRINITY_DN15506_c0_g1~~TRINITY_DN15506_c0_g1_i1.p1  ORF type:complete len:216 (+),score=51.78 TRINITY_DN15506_c0_g1_i1:59-649(+)